MKYFPEDHQPTPQELQANFEAVIDAFPNGEPDCFTGIRRWRGVGRVYGGQVIAQALSAATRTVDPERAVHSLHAYFLRGASEDHEIDYRVTREFDGRSFSNRRVTASQNGEPVLSFSASFQRHEDGPSFQATMPHVTPPEELESQEAAARRMADKLSERVRKLVARPNALDVRSVGAPPFTGGDAASREPTANLWFKTKSPVQGGETTHSAVLAFASDLAPLAAAFNPHRGTGFTRISSASLDHAVWFHEPARTDEWLLFTTDTPWSGHARAYGRGLVFTRDGRLVASVVQEGLMRLGPGDAPPF